MNNNFRTYRGATLERNTKPGYRLRWTAYIPSRSETVAADTLQGVKQLVREKTRKG
jgi:hypothetical protein